MTARTRCVFKTKTNFEFVKQSLFENIQHNRVLSEFTFVSLVIELIFVQLRF
jgi:hypothetical protein